MVGSPDGSGSSQMSSFFSFFFLSFWALKDAGNKLTDYKNFGVADLPEGQAEPSAEEEMNLLS